MARRVVAVMVSRFPLITETFVLRELIELERQGQPLVLVPMLKETPRVVHPEAIPWIDRALYTPYLSAAILGANLRVLRRRPFRYLGLLLRLIAGTLLSPGFLVRTVAIFPKSVYLGEQLARQGVRHIHAHFATHPATMAFIASWFHDLSYSITAHAHDIFVDRALLGLKLRHAAYIRAISDFNRRYLATRYPEGAEKIGVIHVGIDPGRYRGGRGHAVLCIGAFKPYKGIPVLIQACELLKQQGVEFRCEIIGDGPMRTRIEQMIRAADLHDRVILLGNRSQEEVAERIAGAAVVVQPSIVAPDGQMEGIPVSLMEAMAAGKPVIASDLSGIPELVEHDKTGLLVKPGEAAGLSAAIRELLSKPERCAGMGQAGREKVTREFVLPTTVEQLLHRLDEVNPSVELTAEQTALLEGASLAVRRVHERKDSRVVEVLADGAELIVKTQKNRPGQSRPPVERAAREFEILERLAANGMAPRPLRRKGASILMHRATGIALDHLIRIHRGNPRQLVEPFAAAGRWLRQFQLMFPAQYHGDFWPGNIFIAADGVQVIDFEGMGQGSPSRDAASFLVESKRFFSRPWHRRGFAPLRDAFLSAYRGSSRPLPASGATRSD